MSTLVVLLALLQSAGSTTPQPPPPAVAPAVSDPASLSFPDGTAGLVLVLVKADRISDYEAVVLAIRGAAQSASDADRALVAGWRVLKAREPDAKGNAVYVHWIATPVVGADYRPSVVLARLMAALPEELLVKYRDAFAAAPTRLALDDVPLPPPGGDRR